MRTSFRFLLNGRYTEISEARPDTTLLNWLRQTGGLTGTKEGCAEGDCGACTVVIARADGVGGLNYQQVNSCITFLPVIDGASVTTVEGVAGPDGALHPVQQAVVDCHGAQCGFCTPGFILSLYAGWCQGMEWTEQGIDSLLSGNLCRCTGYGPLVRAGLSLAGAAVPDWETERHAAELAFVNDHADDTQDLQVNHDGQRYDAPASLDRLEQICKDNPEARILAGGTDIGLWVTKQHRDISHFIALGRTQGLNRIDITKTDITIGAAVSHTAARQRLVAYYPGLADMWARFGSAQVRQSATVCGNVANGSPIGDLPPCFLALDGEVVLNHGGQVRRVKLSDFFIDYGQQDRRPGEFIQALSLPKLTENQQLCAYKLSKRFDQDISAVLMAIWADIKDDIIISARIACGGMAAVPKRAFYTEKAITGHNLNSNFSTDQLDRMDADFAPIDDMRASREYRALAAKNLLQKFCLEYRAGPLRLSPVMLSPDMLSQATAGTQRRRGA